MDEESRRPRTILEAASLASQAAVANPQRQMDLSLIPLLVHQTWATARLETWSPDILPCLERWLEYATSPQLGSPMAYLFWDDEGVLAFMREFEPNFVDPFVSLFNAVERADIFRILVCNHFGGIVRSPKSGYCVGVC